MTAACALCRIPPVTARAPNGRWHLAHVGCAALGHDVALVDDTEEAVARRWSRAYGAPVEASA